MDKSDNLFFMNEKKIISASHFWIFNIELTNRCPMKCVMCPRTYQMTRPQGFMDLDLFSKLIDELSGLNSSLPDNRIVWLHHFGESLLHPQFDFCIRYAADKGIKTGLSVNPMVLNENISLSLLNSGLSELFISLDGHDNESFHKIRGIRNMYETSRQKTIDFLKLKKENSCNIKIVLSMIDFCLNDESIEKTNDEWKSLDGIDEFLMKNYITWDGSIEEIHELSPWKKSSKTPELPEATCSFPWANMTVTWDGDVVPCCFDYDKKYILGNAMVNSLSYIWNDLPMQNLRSEFLNNNISNQLCRNCENLRA